MSEATAGTSGPVDDRGERPVERADRNMIEMLQELRVAQTGVQILFAFLLSLSFTERFARIDDFQRWTYVVTLLLTSVTTGLLVAPAAIHRMLFGRGVKAATVRLGHHLFVAGPGGAGPDPGRRGAAGARRRRGPVVRAVERGRPRGPADRAVVRAAAAPARAHTTPRAWTATTRSDTRASKRSERGVG